ncbi:MAG TPA: SDR family oxidoreductase [Methylomirabilota bacterium]|nr:SDR family oxidoreductase [Methylomirabilota bacterium]
MDLKLDGKVAWITGAGGAIGRAIAVALAAQGVQTVLTSRGEAALRATAEAVAKAGGRSPVLRTADVTRADQVDGTADAIVRDLGRIDILVNSTTAPVFGDFLALTDEAWEAAIQTKWLGYVRTLRAVLPHMLRQRDGRIVNVSGGGGRTPTPTHLPGGGVNAAVNHLTKGLAGIYARHNIRINAVAPGPIESERLARIARVQAESAEPRTVPITATPMGRAGEPREVADAVVYLVSDRSTFVTGIVLPVDGGRTPSL